MSLLTLLRRVLLRLTRPPVLTLFAALHAAGMLAVAARYLASLHGPTDAAGKVVTGDFPAFFTAARMLHAGQGQALYSLAAQNAAQTELLGHALATWQPYAYPPLLALALAPVAGASYLAAFYLHDIAMALALAFLLWRLRPLLPSLSAAPRAWATIALLVASFHPVARTLMGGQNTVLSLALLVGFVAFVKSDRPLLAGVCLGLLAYKPQLLPLLLLCSLLRRQWLVLASAAAVCAFHYLVGALACGFGWPLAWLRMLGAYRELEWASNRYTHVSLWALSAQLLPSAITTLVAAALSAFVISLVIGRALDRSVASADLFALAIAATLLVSPHVQYYDVGLLLLPVLLVLEARERVSLPPSPALRLLLALGYLSFPVYLYAPTLGLQPLCVFPLLATGWSFAHTKGLAGSSAGLRNTSKSAGK